MTRISEIRVYQHDLEVAGGLYRMALSDITALDSTVVAVVADGGLIGYGETCPLGSTYQPQHALGARAALAEMAPSLVGLNPLQIGVINAAMDEALAGHRYAKAAVDVACWDLAGQAYDARLCDLLGGPFQDPVPSYYGILPATAEASAAQAERLQADGFTRIQVKTGGRPVDDDIAVMEAVDRVRRPGTKLLADANRGWTQRDAILFSTACRHIPLALEQPCATYEENANLAGRVCHPVFLDESADSVATVARAIVSGAAQGFGMKASRVGGITAQRTVIALCAAHSIPMTSDDTWGGDIVAATTAHLGAIVPPGLFEGTWIAEPYTARTYPTLTPTITNASGSIDLPDGPGLGVEPDLDRWPDPVAVYR